jgi:hypothetical protein
MVALQAIDIVNGSIALGAQLAMRDQLKTMLNDEPAPGWL